MGPRRSDRVARRDGAPQAELPSRRLAEPAHRNNGLRAADAGTAGCLTVRGRFPAGAKPQQSRGAGGTLEHARRAGLKSPPLRSKPMDISGSYRFDAPPERVWNLLMDPAADPS